MTWGDDAAWGEAAEEGENEDVSSPSTSARAGCISPSVVRPLLFADADTDADADANGREGSKHPHAGRRDRLGPALGIRLFPSVAEGRGREAFQAAASDENAEEDEDEDSPASTSLGATQESMESALVLGSVRGRRRRRSWETGRGDDGRDTADGDSDEEDGGRRVVSHERALNGDDQSEEEEVAEEGGDEAHDDGEEDSRVPLRGAFPTASVALGSGFLRGPPATLLRPRSHGTALIGAPRPLRRAAAVTVAGRSELRQPPGQRRRCDSTLDSGDVSVPGTDRREGRGPWGASEGLGGRERPPWALARERAGVGVDGEMTRGEAAPAHTPVSPAAVARTLFGSPVVVSAEAFAPTLFAPTRTATATRLQPRDPRAVGLATPAKGSHRRTGAPLSHERGGWTAGSEQENESPTVARPAVDEEGDSDVHRRHPPTHRSVARVPRATGLDECAECPDSPDEAQGGGMQHSAMQRPEGSMGASETAGATAMARRPNGVARVGTVGLNPFGSPMALSTSTADMSLSTASRSFATSAARPSAASTPFLASFGGRTSSRAAMGIASGERPMAARSDQPAVSPPMFVSPHPAGARMASDLSSLTFASEEAYSPWLTPAEKERIAEKVSSVVAAVAADAEASAREAPAFRRTNSF